MEIEELAYYLYMEQQEQKKKENAETEPISYQELDHQQYLTPFTELQTRFQLKEFLTQPLLAHNLQTAQTKASNMDELNIKKAYSKK